jgi:hypothetical protein
MMRHITSMTLAAGMALAHLLCPFHVARAQAAAADSGAAAQPVVTKSPYTIGGFVDTYFSWNLARPASRTNRLRNFDVTEHQFVVSAAEVDFQRTADPIGFRVELNVGGASDIIHAGSSESLKLVQQAYLTGVIPVGAGLTVDAGKFFTHMGFETVKAKDNYNYSRSFLFAWATPYYHLGFRASYPILANFSATVLLSNGWNNVEVNSGKTFGASLSYSPMPSLTLLANWLGGPEQPDSVSSEFRHVVEGIASLRVTDQLVISADGTYGTEALPSGTVTWKGIALYGQYGLTDNSALSLRGEVYSDPQGYTTALAQELKEVTVTYEYRFHARLIVRGEYRYDWSTAAPFDDESGGGARSNQSTIALAGIVTF